MAHLARNMMDLNSVLIFRRSEGPRRPMDVSMLMNLSWELTSFTARINCSRKRVPLAFICAHNSVSDGVRLNAFDCKRRISRTGYITNPFHYTDQVTAKHMKLTVQKFSCRSVLQNISYVFAKEIIIKKLKYLHPNMA